MRRLSAILTIPILTFAPETFGLECSNEEVGYIATFQVKAGRETEFEAVVVDLAAKVAELEPGAVLYAPYKGSRPGVYYMLERYRDEAARQAHGKAEQISAIFPRLVPLLAEQVDVKAVSALCPR